MTFHQFPESSWAPELQTHKWKSTEAVLPNTSLNAALSFICHPSIILGSIPYNIK